MLVKLWAVDQDVFSRLVFLSARAVLVFFREEAAAEFACVSVASPALDESAESFTRSRGPLVAPRGPILPFQDQRLPKTNPLWISKVFLLRKESRGTLLHQV